MRRSLVVACVLATGCADYSREVGPPELEADVCVSYTAGEFTVRAGSQIALRREVTLQRRDIWVDGRIEVYDATNIRIVAGACRSVDGP